MDQTYYIQGTRPTGEICIFDGCHNPYDISLSHPPLGFCYDNRKDAENKISEIENVFVKIEWKVITHGEFVKLRLDWCRKYIKENE